MTGGAALSGRLRTMHHANKQGRIAGTNATGGDVAFPGVIGTAVSRICRYEVARTGLSEKEAAAVGLAVVTATIKSVTRAGYYPGADPIWVKLIAHADGGRLLGGQIVGVEGAAKRIEVLATAIWSEMGTDELELLDLGYAPPFSGVYDQRTGGLLGARIGANSITGPQAPRSGSGQMPIGGGSRGAVCGIRAPSGITPSRPA